MITVQQSLAHIILSRYYPGLIAIGERNHQLYGEGLVGNNNMQ